MIGVKLLPFLVFLSTLSTLLLVVNGNYFLSKVIRRWFVAGNFRSVAQTDGSVLQVNNIASWNGKKWRGYNGGTNGPISALFVDSCSNIYIAGNFTSAGGVETGPFAIWRRYASNWQPLGILRNHSNADVIHTISADCYHIPVDASKCKCDVYIGGFFEFTLNNNSQTIAHNIARYNAHLRSWENMGGIERHNITTAVRTIDKRDFGLVPATGYAWIGGDGFLKRYFYEHGQFSWETRYEIESDHIISSVYYDPSYYDPFDVLVAGKFIVNVTRGNTLEYCENLCIFNSASNSWSKPSPYLNSAFVGHASSKGGVFLASGNLVIPGPNDTQIHTTMSLSSTKFNKWITISDSDEENLPTTVYDFVGCSRSDALCYRNSITIVGEGEDINDGYIKNYNSHSGMWESFGRGFNGSGVAYVITAKNWVDSSSINTVWNSVWTVVTTTVISTMLSLLAI